MFGKKKVSKSEYDKSYSILDAEIMRKVHREDMKSAKDLKDLSDQYSFMYEKCGKSRWKSFKAGKKFSDFYMKSQTTKESKLRSIAKFALAWSLSFLTAERVVSFASGYVVARRSKKYSDFFNDEFEKRSKEEKEKKKSKKK